MIQLLFLDLMTMEHSAVDDNLVMMQGIGPASASAILTAAFPCFPYFSDEAIEVVLKKKEYTVKRYIEFAVAIREKAQQLSTEGSPYPSCSLLYQNHAEGLIL